jgi:hypothetical protein
LGLSACRSMHRVEAALARECGEGMAKCTVHVLCLHAKACSVYEGAHVRVVQAFL